MTIDKATRDRLRTEAQWCIDVNKWCIDVNSYGARTYIAAHDVIALVDALDAAEVRAEQAEREREEARADAKIAVDGLIEEVADVRRKWEIDADIAHDKSPVFARVVNDLAAAEARAAAAEARQAFTEGQRNAAEHARNNAETRCDGLATALEHAERTLRGMASDARHAIAAHAGSAPPVDDASPDDAACCKCSAPATRQTRMTTGPWCIDIWYYCDAHAPKSARPIAPHADAAARERELLGAIGTAIGKATRRLALLRDLVVTLPKCDDCDAPATRAWHRNAGRWCDDHVREIGAAKEMAPDYPRAPALRAAMSELAAADAPKAAVGDAP